MRGPGIRKSDFIEVRPTERTLNLEQMALVLQAATRFSGNPMAGNWRGDVATLIAPGRVQLSITGKDGGSHYMIDVPQEWVLSMTVLEEPDAN